MGGALLISQEKDAARAQLPAQPQPRGPFTCDHFRGSVCSERVAVRLSGGVALHCRESVPSRLTDCKRVGKRPYSPKQPLLARSSPLHAEGGDTKLRVAISVRYRLSLSCTASPVRAASDNRLGVGALYALLKVGWYSSSNCYPVVSRYRPGGRSAVRPCPLSHGVRIAGDAPGRTDSHRAGVTVPCSVGVGEYRGPRAQTKARRAESPVWAPSCSPRALHRPLPPCCDRPRPRASRPCLLPGRARGSGRPGEPRLPH